MIGKRLGVGTDDDTASIGQGIASIGGQVQHRQFELIDIGHDRLDLRWKTGFQGHRRPK
ncbi:hypothetical protein D3C84_1037930 [compost metagenome]